MNGHVPPEGWDDIDDPDEDPNAALPEISVDEVAVDRAVSEVLQGEKVSLVLNLFEKAEAARRLIELGIPPSRGRRLLGDGKGIVWQKRAS